jgi:hypothetical protein
MFAFNIIRLGDVFHSTNKSQASFFACVTARPTLSMP